MFSFDASKAKTDPPEPMFITLNNELQLKISPSPILHKKVMVTSLVGGMAALTIGQPKLPETKTKLEL